MQELFANDYAAARQIQEAKLKLARETGEVFAISNVLSNLTFIYLLQGEVSLARANLKKLQPDSNKIAGKPSAS